MATDTSKYKLNHSMIRVKDPEKSVKFYEFLGMKVIETIRNPENKFDLYFLAYDSPGAASHGALRSDREGLIELTHNYGTELDPEYKVVNGNAEPYRGFGHVAISVDNIQAACKRIEDAGYQFKKKLSDGSMRDIAFALDPDGYWVEIIIQKPVQTTENVTTTDVSTYRMNHTMIRCKDPKKSLDFYQNVMGMTLISTYENNAAKFTNYFLGYPPAYEIPSSSTPHYTAHREGLLELTWNHGTENDPNFSYHDGNKQPQGFGHICVAVDDLDAACARFEDKQVNWKKRLTDGRMRDIAFVLDPDGYWIEVIQNHKNKSAL
ncbi:glyoxylase I [Xylogone sp. PMI_703]|nr:glyoxylase I [Xylogone sp. PMI_703]